MRWERSSAILLLLVGASCGDDGALLAVDLRTDFVLGEELASLELDSVHGPENVFVRSGALDGDGALGIRVAEVEGLDPGLYHFQAVGRRADGSVLAETEFLVEIRGTVVARVLLSRDCRDVTCPIDGAPELTACVGGRCEDPRCGAGDVARCANEPECTSASDCGESPECGRWTCEDGLCLVVSDASTCAPGQWCQPETGCIAGSSDAGQAEDAGSQPQPDAGDAADAGGTEDAGSGDDCAGDEDCVGGECASARCEAGRCIRRFQPDCSACGDGVCVAGNCTTPPARIRYDFEDGLPGWGSDATEPWRVDSSRGFLGFQSVSSGAIGHEERSSLVYQADLPRDAYVRFWVATDSERGFDHLLAYVDGDLVGGWSGRTDWTAVVAGVSPGLRRIEWRYDKDWSSSEGRDRAWIDEVEVVGLADGETEGFEDGWPSEAWTPETGWSISAERPHGGASSAVHTGATSVLTHDLTLADRAVVSFSYHGAYGTRLDVIVDGEATETLGWMSWDSDRDWREWSRVLEAGSHVVEWRASGDLWLDDVTVRPEAASVCE